MSSFGPARLPNIFRSSSQCFKLLRKQDFASKPKSVTSVALKVPYLGHLITESGIKMDPNRIKAVSEMQHPTTKQLVQRYLGFISYYRRFIPNLSRIETPIRQILTKEHFEWTKEADVAFEVIKKLFERDVILAYPDTTQHFVLDTDASKNGLGAVLSQIDKTGVERPIAFASEH